MLERFFSSVTKYPAPFINFLLVHVFSPPTTVSQQCTACLLHPLFMPRVGCMNHLLNNSVSKSKCISHSYYISCVCVQQTSSSSLPSTCMSQKYNTAGIWEFAHEDLTLPLRHPEYNMAAVVFGTLSYAQYDFFEYRQRQFHVSQQMCHICFIPLFPVQEFLFLDSKAKNRLNCCTCKGVLLSWFCCGIPTCSMRLTVSNEDRKNYLISKAEECFLAPISSQPGSQKNVQYIPPALPTLPQPQIVATGPGHGQWVVYNPATGTNHIMQSLQSNDGVIEAPAPSGVVSVDQRGGKATVDDGSKSATDNGTHLSEHTGTMKEPLI